MGLGIQELLKKYKDTQTRVLLSTKCGTFSGASGTIKDVFDEFFLFLTVDDKFADNPQLRNWITFDNLGVVTEEPKGRLSEADVEIVR